jgi:hypothetical protein
MTFKLESRPGFDRDSVTHCARSRSRDSRHAITLEGKALVTPFGWNIKAESEDSARGPSAKPRAAGEMLKL